MVTRAAMLASSQHAPPPLSRLRGQPPVGKARAEPTAVGSSLVWLSREPGNSQWSASCSGGMVASGGCGGDGLLVVLLCCSGVGGCEATRVLSAQIRRRMICSPVTSYFNF